MNFYVRDLLPDVGEADLRRVFERFGEIESVTFLEDEAGQPLGVGVVVMPQTNEGLSVVNSLVGMQLDGQTFDVGGPRSEQDRRGDGDRRVSDRGTASRRSAARRAVA